MSERNSNFDWLRLFLASSVAYFHAGYFSTTVNGMDAPIKIIPFPLVPTFLALSGVLMFRSFATSSSYLHFIWKRALRILPALVVALAVSGLVWGFQAGVVGSLLVYLGGGVLFSGAGNGSLWSLFWEEIAYGLMAALLAIKAYDRRWAIWLLWAISCAIAANWDQVEPVWRITNLIPALFTGNLVYLYRAQVAKLPWKAVLAAIVVITVGNKVLNLQPQAWYMVPIGCFLALVLCLNAPQLPRLPVDLSYGIYVFHDPIYYAAFQKWPSSFYSGLVPGTVALLTLSTLSWYYVEKPAILLKRRLPAQIPQTQ